MKNKVKSFNQLFEQNKNKIQIGKSIFTKHEHGLEIEDLEYIYHTNKIHEIEYLYEKGDYKILLLNKTELYLSYEYWISDLNTIASELIHLFFETLDKEENIKKQKEYADVLIIYKGLLKKTYEEVLHSQTYKNYSQSKKSKEFNL